MGGKGRKKSNVSKCLKCVTRNSSILTNTHRLAICATSVSPPVLANQEQSLHLSLPVTSNVSTCPSQPQAISPPVLARHEQSLQLSLSDKSYLSNCPCHTRAISPPVLASHKQSLHLSVPVIRNQEVRLVPYGGCSYCDSKVCGTDVNCFLSSPQLHTKRIRHMQAHRQAGRQVDGLVDRHTHTHKHTCMCMYACMHAHMYTSTHIPTHTCTHIHTCTHTTMYTACAHPHRHAHTHMHTHTHNAHMYTHIYICTHACTHVHTCPYTHAHIYTHTHTHTTASIFREFKLTPSLSGSIMRVPTLERMSRMTSGGPILPLVVGSAGCAGTELLPSVTQPPSFPSR